MNSNIFYFKQSNQKEKYALNKTVFICWYLYSWWKVNMFFLYMLYLHLNQQQISKQHVIFLCVTLLHLYTCHMALGWEQLQLTPPSCLSLFLSLSFSVSLSPCVSPSVSLTPSHPSLSPLPPALVCITGFPPLQSPILFHGNWLSMRGSGGGAGGGGEGGGWV